MSINKYCRWLAGLFFAAGTGTPHAQAPAAVALADVHRLKCTFTLLTYCKFGVRLSAFS